MNKTEKLLAARKKLKEFQLNKGNHSQLVDTSHRRNINENVTNENVINKIEETLPLIKTEKLDETVSSVDDSQNLGVDSQNNGSANNSVNDKVHETIFPETVNKDFLGFTQDIENSSILSVKEVSSKSNDFEPQSISQNGNHLNNEMNVQNNTIKHFTFLQEPSISPLVNTDNLNSNEHEPQSSLTNNELENQNKVLNTYLEREKCLVDQLNLQLNQYREKIIELETCLTTKNFDLEAETMKKINHLQEQIQFHTQTTNILVAEKAELSASLTVAQVTVNQQCNEIQALNEKLSLKQNRIDELEKELHQTKNVADEIQGLYHQLKNSNESLNHECTILKKSNDEQNMEIAELRQELNIKSVELVNLSKILEENKNALSLSELKIQQLTNATQEPHTIGNENQSQALAEQQLIQMKENIKVLTTEKDELCKHYDSYVKQLDVKYENVMQEFKAAQVTINEYKEREESFIQRLSLMEQQYQREKQKAESLLPTQEYDTQIKHLTQSIDSLVLEQETLQGTLREKDSEIETLKEELKELLELRNQSGELSKLVKALESEQLGASRAVSQNKQLKSQLSEMHDAFVTLSNSKLNLTEQLQDERVVGRKLNKELNRVEMERDKLREEILNKEEIIKELEKEKLQTAQIADQMHHYQAQSYQTRTLEQELKNALNSIEVLKAENTKLLEQIKNSNRTNENSDQTEIENIGNEKTGIKTEIENIENESTGIKTEAENIGNESTGINYDELKETKETQIDPDDLMSEPLMKLEKRFKETIERVAELTDEKQRLEHLVLQLQGETETIGEYVTLYQKQRAILHMKAQEREQIFRQLIEQRNVQQLQLHQLKVLVADLLKHKNELMNKNKENDLNTHTDQNAATNVANEKLLEENSSEPEKVEQNETAAKILELLTEIKDCKDTCSLEPNFHPCLWCSGKLITV